MYTFLYLKKRRKLIKKTRAYQFSGIIALLNFYTLLFNIVFKFTLVLCSLLSHFSNAHVQSGLSIAHKSVMFTSTIKVSNMQITPSKHDISTQNIFYCDNTTIYSFKTCYKCSRRIHFLHRRNFYLQAYLSTTPIYVHVTVFNLEIDHRGSCWPRQHLTGAKSGSRTTRPTANSPHTNSPHLFAKSPHLSYQLAPLSRQVAPLSLDNSPHYNNNEKQCK